MLKVFMVPRGLKVTGLQGSTYPKAEKYDDAKSGEISRYSFKKHTEH